MRSNVIKVGLIFPEFSGIVIGGPYNSAHEFPKAFKVKLAVEIDKMADVYLDIHDFQVPDKRTYIAALIHSYRALKNGQAVYVGCMGGIGRTGLLIGGLLYMEEAMIWKEMNPRCKVGSEKFHTEITDPVTRCRSRFKSHAVETQEQESYLHEMDIGGAVAWASRI